MSEFIILLCCFVIFLYSMFVFCKDDFLLLRKNIALEHIFNMCFVGFALSLLGARILYVFFHLSRGYLDPLVFFVFPYFPGLSLSGGIGGAAAFFYFFGNKKKLPLLRVCDISILSFFWAVAFGQFVTGILTLLSHKIFLYPLFFSCAVILLIGFGMYRLWSRAIGDNGFGFAALSIFLFSQSILTWVLAKNSWRSSLGEMIAEVVLGILFFVLFIKTRKK